MNRIITYKGKVISLDRYNLNWVLYYYYYYRKSKSIQGHGTIITQNSNQMLNGKDKNGHISQNLYKSTLSR
jgi:hypothetical protein